MIENSSDTLLKVTDLKKNKNIYKTMHDRISNEATYTRQNRTFLRQKRSETAKRITKSSNDIIKASTIIYQI